MSARTILWDGTAIRFPTTMTWSFQDISSKDTGRALSGLMSKQIIATKRKIVCTWKLVSDVDANALLGTIKNQTYGDLTYPDAFSGTDRTATFYTGDAEATMMVIDGSSAVWDIKFDFIER